MPGTAYTKYFYNNKVTVLRCNPSILASGARVLGVQRTLARVSRTRVPARSAAKRPTPAAKRPAAGEKF